MENASFAEELGLRYVSDSQPGFRRTRRGKSFRFLDHERNPITHDQTLERIRMLAIPPAWDGVWICRFQNGHLQATGRDARSRKQYRYHGTWNQVRNETKFSKLIQFGSALPSLRERLDQDLEEKTLSRANVLAAVVKIMERTMIRIGNDAYAEENDTYGLTTLLNRHVKVEGAKAKFKFRGKHGIVHETFLEDRRLARIVRRCKELPGQELFAYEEEDGTTRDIESGDVNAYLKEISGENITAKDFRTWGATVHAARVLFEMGPPESDTKKELATRQCAAATRAARHLGNTLAVCRKYYVHPAIFEADASGDLDRVFRKVNARANRNAKFVLSPTEIAVMELLDRTPATSSIVNSGAATRRLPEPASRSVQQKLAAVLEPLALVL